MGLALFLALIAAAAVAAVRVSEARRDRAERGAALAVALALWLVHAIVDYDWDFVAVTGTAISPPAFLPQPGCLLAVAVAAAGAAGTRARGHRVGRDTWLAERELRLGGTSRSTAATSKPPATRSSARAHSTRSRSSLSSQTRGLPSRGGARVAALQAYREATRLQPKNPESWLQLGLYEFDIGDRCAAYRDLNQAYTLDPAGKQWRPGGPLVVSLAWVNAGNCG